MLLPVASNLLRRLVPHRDIIRSLLRQQQPLIASTSPHSASLSSLLSVSTPNVSPSPSPSSTSRRQYSTTPRRFPIKWEPDDVGLPPDVQPYESLCVEMKGYDFAVLEKFAVYVHKLCNSLGHSCDAFAMPAKTAHTSTYRPRSSVIDNTYDLQLYERDVVLNDLTNTALPQLISLLTCHLPEGVTIRIRHHTDTDEEYRYIPDRLLLELHGQLDDLGQSKKKK